MEYFGKIQLSFNDSIGLLLRSIHYLNKYYGVKLKIDSLIIEDHDIEVSLNAEEYSMRTFFVHGDIIKAMSYKEFSDDGTDKLEPIIEMAKNDGYDSYMT